MTVRRAISLWLSRPGDAETVTNSRLTRVDGGAETVTNSRLTQLDGDAETVNDCRLTQLDGGAETVADRRLSRVDLQKGLPPMRAVAARGAGR